MNIIYLVTLAFITATYAVPITNDKPQPLSNDVTVAVEPRGPSLKTSFIVLSCLASVNLMDRAAKKIGLAVEKQYAHQFDWNIITSLEYYEFVQKAVELEAHSPPYESMTATNTNADGPIGVKFFLPGGETRVKHDTRTALEDVKKVLSRHVLGREVQELEGGQLSAGEVFAVAIHSVITIREPRSEPVTMQCPCHLYLRHWSTTGNIYAAFFTATGDIPVADVSRTIPTEHSYWPHFIAASCPLISGERTNQPGPQNG
ncbi:hypothetical protein EV361DRAFT_895260 [Lentinula raphanica]|nr:hypothetical protein EV361DRAFT_895260 [Lentinula raphanica]